MTTRRDELKARVTEFLRLSPLSLPVDEEPECVRALVDFVLQIERETWQQAALAVEEGWTDAGTPLAGVIKRGLARDAEQREMIGQLVQQINSLRERDNFLHDVVEGLKE